MGFLDFEDAHTKIKNRIPVIQGLAKKLNAKYIKGYEEVKYKFNIKDEIRGIEESNGIVGETQGFEYCFLEYFHEGNAKYDPSGWITNVYLRMNKDIPDFNLTTKKAAVLKSLSGFVLGLLMFSLIILFFILLFRNDNMRHYTTGSFSNILLGWVSMGAALIYLGAKTYLLVYPAIKTIIDIINQSKYYNIKNPKFRKKYVIFSNNPNKINKIFNENVVSKLIETKPEITEINCHKKILFSRFDTNELLSYASCNTYLTPLLQQAKIMEEVE